MTIKNTAGDGAIRGQAISVYADADICRFENVKITGCQDTLFCAPLPLKERQKNGFVGPREFSPRKKTKQYYKNCEIHGDVDFIFGGADAVFDDCLIQCNNRETKAKERAEGRFINGYVTAASGLKDDLGFVFRNCTVKGETGCAPGSVFLGRPWREEAKTVYLNCKMDDTISPERFSGWKGIDAPEPLATYGEYGTVNQDGQPVSMDGRNSWVQEIDGQTYSEIMKKADEICNL